MPLNFSPNHWTRLKSRQIFFIALILLSGINLVAQNPFIQRITTSEGLPSNCVHRIFQDSRKFLWFATDAGVARFDGLKFDYFRQQDGLSSNDVLDIKEDSFGRIWFFMADASLNYYSGNLIHNEKNTPFLKDLKTPDYFRRLYEDKNHNLYFYFHNQKLIYCVDPQNMVSQYMLPDVNVDRKSKRKKAINGMAVCYMYKNDNNEFILYANSGCYKMNSLTDSATLISNAFGFRDILASSDQRKFAILKAKDTTKYEIKRFNHEIAFDSIKALVPAPSNYVSSILEDNSGLLWISTFDKGAYCFRDGKEIFHFDVKDAESIIQDHENNIWISSMKEGVYKISPYFHHIRHFDNSVFDNSPIYALCGYDSLKTWCTNGKVIYLNNNNLFYKLDFQKTENSINQILQLNPKTLITGEIDKLPFVIQGIRINEARKSISYDRVAQSKYTLKRIIYNKSRDQISSFKPTSVIWLSTSDYFGHLRSKELNTRIFNTYYNTDNELVVNAKINIIIGRDEKIKACPELKPFSHKIISQHLNLTDKTELFNIEGDSLFLLDNKKIYNLSAAFEQPIDLQIKHLEYDDSTLFISTSKNLFICKKPLNLLENKPVDIHMVNINFRSIHDILINNGNLIVASDEGLSVIPYTFLLKPPSFTPIPYFQSIKINDVECLMNNSVVNMKTNQRLNITIGCINYSISPIIYSYKLGGIKDDWTVVKESNVVLHNLSTGKYSFELRARKPGSRWSEAVHFDIEATATIWQHPLLYFALILLFTSIAVILIIKRKNQELKRRLMENQIIQLEQKSLQAMMNPHFIFNTLGSIQNYLLHNKPYEAGIYLSKFARLIRQNFNALDTPMINLEEEVDRLKNYLELERLRTTEKFDYAINIDETIESDDVLIPSMIIQPFAENAVWHGIANLEEKGEININIRMIDDKSLEIKVSDTGIGIKNAAKFSTKSDHHLQLGMNITWKRLNLLSQKYKVKTDISFAENMPGLPNPGVIVTIKVPFIYGKSGERD